MTKNRRVVLWSAILLPAVAVSTLAFVSRSRLKHSSENGELPFHPAYQSAPAFKPRIRVWISANDIRPRIVHTRPGKIILEVDNQTLISPSLQVQRLLTGRTEVLPKITAPAQTKRFDRELVLGVGTYEFFEASRPNIRGRLIVEPEAGGGNR
jgi:hypothetical protein